MGSGKMLWLAVLAVVLEFSHSITISSNGNSPERKGISIEMKNIEVGGFVPIQPLRHKQPALNSYTAMENKYLNSTKLPVNERYRRLIPYMTFYLANDFNNPQNQLYSPKVQLQKVAVPVSIVSQNQNGKNIAAQYTNIPRYQGNRLSQFNIASAYPNKVIQDYYPQQQQNYIKYASSHESQYTPVQGIMRAPPKQASQNTYGYQRPIAIPVKINPVHIYNAADIPNVQYYSSHAEPEHKPQQQYKLVPYEQTPPVQVPHLSTEDYFVPKAFSYSKKPSPAVINIQSSLPVSEMQEASYQHHHLINDNGRDEQKYQNDAYKYTQDQYLTEQQVYNEQNYQPAKDYVLKKPVYNLNPTTESGFVPMINNSPSLPSPPSQYSYVTTAPYTSSISPDENNQEFYTVSTRKPQIFYKPRPTKVPVLYTSNSEDYADNKPNLNYGPSSGDQFEQNNLAKILKSLQNSHTLPQTITKDNIDSSLKTLVQILNNLKGNQKYVEESSTGPTLSSPAAFQVPVKSVANVQTSIEAPKYNPRPRVKAVTLIKPTVNIPSSVHEYPSQDIEIEHPVIKGHGSGQIFPVDQNDLGGTPGRPGVDYPALSTIPSTSFDCKTQRYKGFFGDPETNCQVWHYCDLNGGQASFLCPNGTIFSQVALTCDWWFNVKCSTTTQLYVLNERLYKYILPYSPKFPEDYSGPLVDKYISIKFKEMEEKMKKKKKVLKPETTLETEKADVIEIKTSGMSGALRPYEDQ